MLFLAVGQNIRVEVGKHPQVIFAMYFFFFILNKNNERPDWMTDLNTLTPHGLAKLLRSIVYKYRILTSPAFQPCKYFPTSTRIFTYKSEIFRHKTSHMVLSIIFLEDKHKFVLHLSIFYEY
jgi:hypothetical protein